MQANTLARRVFSRILSKRNYSSASHAEPGPGVTMNDVPVPQGSWQTQYDANQRKYNAHLIFGVVFTVVSCVFAQEGGYLNLNYLPPDQPADS